MTPKARPLERECDCGCGKLFVPARKHQHFYSPACRRAAWEAKNSTPTVISKLRKDHADILARIERIEKHLGMEGL